MVKKKKKYEKKCGKNPDPFTVFSYCKVVNTFTFSHLELRFHNTCCILDAFNKDQTKKNTGCLLQASANREMSVISLFYLLPAAHFHTGTLLFMKYKLQQEDTSSRFCGKVWFRQLHSTTAQYYMTLNDFGTVVWLQEQMSSVRGVKV